MDHTDVPRLLGVVAVMLVAAKALGVLAQRVGQPAVLGELAAGVILGSSVVGLVDPGHDVLRVLAEIGVVVLLFEIGLETDLRKLLSVGGTAAAVAAAGVVLPFALGYAACRALGLESLVGVVAGATLTATSVGITARVLADLGRLHEPESRVILGAAVIDDVIGLVILAMVASLAKGGQAQADEAPIWIAARITAVAFGFLAVTLILGRWLVPRLAGALDRAGLLKAPLAMALALAFGLAWLADAAGSAMIIGAFAAGLLVRETRHAREIERRVASIGAFFVPIFFVVVGAAVDVRLFNPAGPGNLATLGVGGLLLLAAVTGKFAAGFAPFWFRGNKMAIGIGMIPRGEVGLIFAQMGFAAGVFDRGLFSAVTLMVMATTFMTPPLLKLVFPPRAGGRHRPEGIEELVTEA